tara:strand:- start:199 stop:561 length:363 start_codon:yes stop_codon:yes gene_type:complete
MPAVQPPITPPGVIFYFDFDLDLDFDFDLDLDFDFDLDLDFDLDFVFLVLLKEGCFLDLGILAALFGGFFLGTNCHLYLPGISLNSFSRTSSRIAVFRNDQFCFFEASTHKMHITPPSKT